MTIPTQESIDRALREGPHNWLDAGHCTLSHWSWGSGPDLVFVHGWPLHAATWRRMVPLLADRYTCHLIDLPGTGHSKWDADTRFGIDAHVETLEIALDALKIDRYALIAHDSGGTIARILASRHPDRIVALAMGDTEIPNDHIPSFEIGQKLARLPGAKTFVRTMLRSEKLLRSNYGFRTCFADIDYIETDFRGFFIEPLVNDKRAFAGHMRFADAVDWSVLDTLNDVHAKITAPVRLVWGAKDPLFKLKGAEGMLDSFGGTATMEVFPEGKLFIHEEFPARFVDAIRPTLDDSFAAH